MTNRASTIASLLLLLTACGGRQAAAPDGPATSPEPASPTTAAPAPPVADGDIAGVPGWLAFSAKQGGDLPWDSIKTSAAIFRIKRDVTATGAALVALTVDGATPVQPRGDEEGRYGCDGGSAVELMTFDGAASPGMLWIVAEGTTGRALTLVKSSTKDERRWTLPDHAVVLEKTGVYTAVMRVDDRQVGEIDVSKDLMDGYEAEPLDLDSPFFLPQAVAAWTVAGHTLVGLYWDSFEGTHFEILVLETGKRHSLHYLYRCAF